MPLCNNVDTAASIHKINKQHVLVYKEWLAVSCDLTWCIHFFLHPSVCEICCSDLPGPPRDLLAHCQRKDESFPVPQVTHSGPGKDGVFCGFHNHLVGRTSGTLLCFIVPELLADARYSGL